MIVTSLILAALLLQGSQSGPEERVKVEYVFLDVIAVDKNNRLVTDLTLEDFTVTENKRPVKIQSFDLLDLRASANVDEAAGTSEGGGRSVAPGVARYILALDLSFAELSEVHRSFGQLEDFLKQAEPRPNVAYRLFSLESGFLMEDFEGDPQTVLRALTRYRTEYLDELVERGKFQGRATDTAPLGTDNLADLEDRFEACAHHGQSALGRAEVRDCIYGELELFLQLLDHRTARAIQELEELAYRFQNVDGIKSIVFLSPGFSLEPGAAAIELARLYFSGTAGDEGRGATGNFDWVPDSSSRRSSFKEEFNRVVHACVRNRVVFHTFDIYNFNLDQRRRTSVRFDRNSSRVVTVYQDHARELNGGLIELADQSGGYFHSGPDLGNLTSVMDGTRFIYALGYQSPSGKREFRKIRVKCKRKGVRLLHRSGYLSG